MGGDVHIRVLPDHVANKIAAGEVVERPASILKELIENAIDAGSTRVDVEITSGGRKLVSVSDDGPGMDRDDALLCVERHATSKISDVDDIEHIGTLGFRGEALAAISSVCRFRLVTCRDPSAGGTEVTMTGGKISGVSETGCPRGTTIQVRDLFFNVPARRKFLRSYQTETAHCRTVFLVQALGHPSLAMSLKIDGREIYALSIVTALGDRIRDLFGPDFEGNMRPADHNEAGITVRGYAGLPAFSRSDRREQYFFVNGRATAAPMLHFALREAYRTLLPADRHPAVILFLDMDRGLVDVNVHPTKREVRFRESGDVRDAVIAGIRKALETPAGTGREEHGDRPETREAREIPGPQVTIPDLPISPTFSYPRRPMRDFASPDRAGGAAGPFEPAAGADTTIQNRGSVAVEPPPGSPWSWCRVLGQVGGLYVVLETEDGLVLMDPHAAHERVLFERYMAAVTSGKPGSQGLLLPETIELRPTDANRVRKSLPVLQELGFGVSEFGGDTFVVDAVPAVFSRASGKDLLLEICTNLEQAGARGSEERWREETIARAACRTAVKAHDSLTLREIEQLVVDLSGTEMPYTCPHGRPTLILTPFKELNRKFGRE